MKLTLPKNKRTVLNITPLIDVLFILIIFFVVSSTFLEQPGFKLDLPKAQTSEVARVEKAILNISGEGKLFLGADSTSLEKLGEQIRKSMENATEKTLIINADEKVHHGLVVSVMEIARSNNVERLVVSTQQPEGGPEK
ncbi:MAG: biopolymer transporter ExbD [Calditrichaeota bacterium]|nr:biopolymer transporter ExbD [Calditrichota bacterium]HQU71029.1 biopolymer transporter ExbD [Calditrichia bacterium]